MSTSNNPGQDFDLTALAMSALSKGYDRDRIKARLEEIVRRNAAYVNRPYRQGRPHNDRVREDNEVLALILAQYL